MLIDMHKPRWMAGVVALVVVAVGIADGDVQTSPLLAAAAQDSDARIANLIAELGSSRYVDRQRAHQELVQLGVQAFEPIQAAVGHPDPEVAAAAEHILGEIVIPWTNAADPPAIQDHMREFGSYSDPLRLQKISLLSQSGEPQSVSALCRIVRYDATEMLSRSAALAILRPRTPRPDATPQLGRRLKKEVSDSRRLGAHWVRLYAAQLESPAGVVESWQQEFDNQLSEYRRLMEQRRSAAADTDDAAWGNDFRHLQSALDFEEISDVFTPEVALGLARQIAVDVGWHLFRLQVELDHTGEALATFDRVVEHDPQQFDVLAVEAIDRLAEQRDVDTLDLFLTRHEQRLSTSRRAQYAAAIAMGRQGRAEEAAQLAERALEQQVDPYDRIVDAGEFLLKRQQWKWAEKEYRKVVASDTLQLQLSLFASFRLAELLHDSEEYAEAAAELETLEDRIDQDEGFRKSYNQVREHFTRRGMRFARPKELTAQRQYYLACLAHQEQDPEKERAYLRTSFELDPTNPDVLIAMHRADPGNDAWQAEVRERIRQYADKVDADIRELETSANRFRANEEMQENLQLELQQLYNQWAWLVSNTEGDFQKAIRYSTKSLELAPNSAGYLDTLGRCYYAAGDYENAVKYQRQAVELEPSMQVMQRQLTLFEQALDQQQDHR